MELLLKHRKVIQAAIQAADQAADHGRVWRDATGQIYISRRGNRNLGWPRTAITTEADELLDAGYLHESDDGVITATDTGRAALGKATPNRFPIVTAQVA